MKAGDLVVRLWLGKKYWRQLGIITRRWSSSEYGILWYLDGVQVHNDSQIWRSNEIEVISESR